MAEMSAAASAFAERAKEGRVELQRCDECGAFAWPPRDICARCWSDQLTWTPIAPRGVLLAATALHVAHDEFFKSRMPWRIGTIRLESGPIAYAHLSDNLSEGDAVRIAACADWKGRGVLVALAAAAVAVEDDPKLRELCLHE